jgi:hypothetical protein
MYLPNTTGMDLLMDPFVFLPKTALPPILVA